MQHAKLMTSALSLLLLGVAVSQEITGQTGSRGALAVRWMIDPERSLAWWQVDPNYGHLWATTCPNEPSWQAGEGRSSGYQYKKDPKVSQSEWHSKRIPMWPRDSVRPVCRQAVRGEVAATESRTWRGARGTVRVIGDSLTMGSNMRDKFMHGSILNTNTYPEVAFTLDSIIEVVPGDTVRGVAMGTLHIHGQEEQVRAPVVVWRDGDGLRAQTSFGVAAANMVEKYNMSRWSLSLGVVLGRWNTLHMGVDLFLRPANN